MVSLGENVYGVPCYCSAYIIGYARSMPKIMVGTSSNGDMYRSTHTNVIQTPSTNKRPYFWDNVWRNSIITILDVDKNEGIHKPTGTMLLLLLLLVLQMIILHIYNIIQNSEKQVRPDTLVRKKEARTPQTMQLYEILVNE